MASNLTGQVRNIAEVTTAVANGDLSKKITVDVRGEVAELKETVNTMVDQLRAFSAEVTRVAREVGTEGRLGGQASVEGVSGVWKDLTDNVNFMATSLTEQVRNIAQVTTAVATGDLSKKVTVDVRGEVLELKDTINTMVDQLSSFADEVTRVAREVGTEGKLGGQANVKGVSGTWKDLTDSVNGLASNLTDQVRNIAEVTTAVAKGDLSQKITVDARGEILQLKNTVNIMVDQLSSFAAELTRVAREVGTEGMLGGQAKVEGVSGVWKELTDNFNQLATSLTTQVRAIADVSTAVTEGDLTRQVTVEAKGEVDALKQNVNQMIANLRETTERNAEQDWLNSNLARFSGMMQGQRDLQAVSRLIMSELTPLVGAGYGAFFLAQERRGRSRRLQLIASYGYKTRKKVSNRYKLGESLVGQAALERQSILISEPPEDYVKVASGLGEAAPKNIIVMPVLFEDQVMAVIELAAFQPFSEVQRGFLDQLGETIGIVINTIQATMRTEELLRQSQTPDARAPGALGGAPVPAGGAEARERRARAAGADAQGVRRAAADAAGGAPADERGARGEGAAARGAEPPHRDQEPRDRARAHRAAGARRAARALVEVQERVPREHEPRAAHAAQLAAHPREAARREHRGEPQREADRVRLDDPPGGRRPPRPDQRHPRPLEGRGREDGRADQPTSRSATSATTSSARSSRSRRTSGSSSTVEVSGANVPPVDRRPTSSACTRC